MSDEDYPRVNSIPLSAETQAARAELRKQRMAMTVEERITMRQEMREEDYRRSQKEPLTRTEVVTVIACLVAVPLMSLGAFLMFSTLTGGV